MRICRLAAPAAAFLLFAIASAPSQAAPFTVDVFEDGVIHSTPIDPGTGLPTPVNPGDVVLLTVGGSASDPGTWSDILRFSDTPFVNPFDPGSGGFVSHYFLFSDLDGSPPGVFIDEFTGLPFTGADLGNPVFIIEDSFPTVWSPSPNTYNIYSGLEGGPGGGETDIVPEPSTLALLSMGGLGLIGYVRRRRA